MRDTRYDILFEPVKIGPVRAPNRFYQVPHCNGMGHKHPLALARMREIKAEGGWGVVSTEEVEIHPSSEFAPYIEGRLWDDGDIAPNALMVEAVHKHGSLAACELAYNGFANPNLYSREAPFSPSGGPVKDYSPIQARVLDLTDIRNIRKWHRNAAVRAMMAGFDIIYCYAGHNLALAMHFLSPHLNTRCDEYGGSLTNRVRFLRELIEDTIDAVGHRSAVAVRLAVDQLMGSEGLRYDTEGHEILTLLAELPDLWDVNLADWSNDSVTARFGPEGGQEAYIGFVKKLTTKPVVGVGRFTSPDTMVSQIKRGILDLIGAARPSIADPHLPRKINEGRENEIRECIGCNICVSGDMTITPIRCTQNPTMGEEWRRDWHPERMNTYLKPVDKKGRVLIIGSGPSGLEAARALRGRSIEVIMADKALEPGGRILTESKLPGLSTYRRVMDYRLSLLNQDPKFSLYLDSDMAISDIVDFDVDHVVLATGSQWRKDGVGRAHRLGIDDLKTASIISVDQILGGFSVSGSILIYDDDHYYMGGVLAEKLRFDGAHVTLVTPASKISEWTENTLEQGRIQSRLVSIGVSIITNYKINTLSGGQVDLSPVYGGERLTIGYDHLVPVTSRQPRDGLYHALKEAGFDSVTCIGDCLAPSTVAAAIWSGHAFARYYGEEPEARYDFKRERIDLNP
jgi:dimethylamine/trimethylamine dehydrogenase